MVDEPKHLICPRPSSRRKPTGLGRTPTRKLPPPDLTNQVPSLGAEEDPNAGGKKQVKKAGARGGGTKERGAAWHKKDQRGTVGKEGKRKGRLRMKGGARCGEAL